MASQLTYDRRFSVSRQLAGVFARVGMLAAFLSCIPAAAQIKLAASQPVVGAAAPAPPG